MIESYKALQFITPILESLVYRVGNGLGILVVKVSLAAQLDLLRFHPFQVENGCQRFSHHPPAKRHFTQKHWLSIVINAKYALRTANIQEINRLVLKLRVVVFETVAYRKRIDIDHRQRKPGLGDYVAQVLNNLFLAGHKQNVIALVFCTWAQNLKVEVNIVDIEGNVLTSIFVDRVS